MNVFSSDQFVLPLPEGHRFPMSKYRLLRERLLATAVLDEDAIQAAPPIGDDQLRTVHARSYVERVVSGGLSSSEQRVMGFPWSPGMVERSRRSVGATLAAARQALAMRGGCTPGLAVSCNLAGGTHHAFADRGEGFCVFNDVAVAIRVLQAEAELSTALIVDCDVHQGNGSAAIFRSDSSVFTLSLHGARNYPARKETSDLDVALDDGTSDAAYLERLARALERCGAVSADCVFYLGGADPYVEDRLGRLALTKAGLERRDRAVLRWCAERGVPVVVVMAGGYAPKVEDIVDIHAATVRVAATLASSPSRIGSTVLER